MTAPVIIKYPLDLTGLASTNLVQGELTSIPRTSGRHFVPRNGPFFEKSIVIHTVPGNRELVPDVDYVCLYLYEYASSKAEGSIVAVVNIINPEIYGDLTYDYQVIGGQFSNNVAAIHLLIENLAIDNRVISWDNILDRPVTFPPSPHLHDVADWFGMEAIVAAIQQLTASIANGNLELYEALNSRLDTIVALYNSQQQVISTLVQRTTTTESAVSILDGKLTQLTAQVTEIQQTVDSTVGAIPLDSSVEVKANRTYLITTEADVYLPDITTTDIGEGVVFDIVWGLFPKFIVADVQTQKLRRRGVEDVSITYDGDRPRLQFINVGNNTWEVKI